LTLPDSSLADYLTTGWLLVALHDGAGGWWRLVDGGAQC